MCLASALTCPDTAPNPPCNCVHASTFQSFALAGVEQLYGCIHMGRMNLLDVSTHVKPLDGCLHLITLASAGSRHICVDAWPSCERVSSLCLIIHLPLDMLVSTCRCTWKGCTCTVARIMVPVAVPSTDHVFWITRPADTDRYGAQDACHRDALRGVTGNYAASSNQHPFDL